MLAFPFVICSTCSHWNFLQLQLSWEEGIGYQLLQVCCPPKKGNDITLKGHIAGKSLQKATQNNLVGCLQLVFNLQTAVEHKV